MIVPNKALSLDESVLGRLSWILKAGPDEQHLRDLYRMVSKQFESIDQFLLALDVLYILGRIDIDFQRKKVIYVA